MSGLLPAIAAAAFASTVAGGLLAIGLRDKLHLILGFSAGAVIGAAFFDLLPEALILGGQNDGPNLILALAALGFLLYLVLDRIVVIHGDSAPRGAIAPAVLCVHSLLDGVAIGLAFQASHGVGVVVAIGVLTHDFSDGINTMNLVLRDPIGVPLGVPTGRRRALRWLIVDATAPVVGIAATLLFEVPAQSFGAVLALFAGFFLYIGASDLIPESYHAHPKFLTTAMTLAGAGALYLAVTFIG